jgi:hypothetical protein
VEATTRRIVYLDTNHWYALGRAMAGHPDQPEHVDILRILADQLGRGQLMFPLSAVHYMEIAENPRDHQRKEAADVIAMLSRFITITSAGKILDEELAQSLNRRFGRPAFPIKVKKFGYGATFALTGKERALGRVTGCTEQDRVALEAKLGKSIAEWEAEVDVFTEDMFVRQPDTDSWDQIPGYDPYAARREADKELASFNVMLNTVRTKPDIRARPLDAICARQFYFEIEDNLARAITNAGYTRHWPPLLQGKQALTEFLMPLPSRRVSIMMQYHYLKDLQRSWKINDLRDIAALSRAIPYCDIVVTGSKALGCGSQPGTLGRRVRDDCAASAEGSCSLFVSRWPCGPGAAPAPDSCELRDCGQVQSRVCDEADAEGALDGFCLPRTMTRREPSTSRSRLPNRAAVNF